MNNYQKNIILCSLLFLSTNFAFGAEFYVSPNGSDNNTGLSRETPWRTLSYASSHMQGGGTLILMDGTFTGTVNTNRLSPPSGSAEIYTIIKSENDGQAIIDGSQFTGDYDYPLNISSKSYVRIEGLALRNNPNASLAYINNSDHVKLLRTVSVHSKAYIYIKEVVDVRFGFWVNKV